MVYRKHKTGLMTVPVIDTSGDRKYVGVIADYSVQGMVTPVCVEFEYGRKVEVTKIRSAILTSTTKKGGNETRYDVSLGHRDYFLFFEDKKANPRWFILQKSC